MGHVAQAERHASPSRSSPTRTAAPRRRTTQSAAPDPRRAAVRGPRASIAWLMSVWTTMPLRPDLARQRPRQVAGAAGDVEHPIAGLGRRHRHRIGLPGAVQARATSGRSSGRTCRPPSRTRRARGATSRVRRPAWKPKWVPRHGQRSLSGVAAAAAGSGGHRRIAIHPGLFDPRARSAPSIGLLSLPSS